MKNVISVAYHLSVSGGASGTVSIYSVPGARKLKLKSIRVSFPAGTYSELKIALMRGIEKIFPVEGEVRGDNEVVEAEVDEELSSGSTLRIAYENTNATQTRECEILITGVLDE